jgi:U4/U6 small nuclear ribonucleoprotein PRP3
LKININKQKEQKVKEMLKTQKLDRSVESFSKSRFFDPSLEQNKRRKIKMRTNAFNFAEKGSYLKKVEEFRNKQLEKGPEEDGKVDEVDKKNLDILNIRPSYISNPLKRTNVRIKYNYFKDFIPDIEWWDSYFLPKDKKYFSPFWTKDNEGNYIHQQKDGIIKLEHFQITENDLAKEKISLYIQHPIQIKNEIIEKQNKVQIPTYLTKKERKRIRKIKRAEKEKDKREKQKLGLIKPEPPKIRTSNVLNIMSDSAVQDPAQVEATLRMAYEERRQKMLKENESRKLTKEQKHEKVKKKFERDCKKECKGCLFKIEDLSWTKMKFKIDKNAQQLYLNGICIMNKKKNEKSLPNLVYIEGGPIAVKKFKNLLLRRIKWDSKETEDDENPHTTKTVDGYEITNKCLLLWEGTLKKRLFDKWKMIEVKDEQGAKAILSEKGIEHFWNLVESATA